MESFFTVSYFWRRISACATVYWCLRTFEASSEVSAIEDEISRPLFGECPVRYRRSSKVATQFDVLYCSIFLSSEFSVQTLSFSSLDVISLTGVAENQIGSG
jgi:hypothetical protein